MNVSQNTVAGKGGHASAPVAPPTTPRLDAASTASRTHEPASRYSPAPKHCPLRKLNELGINDPEAFKKAIRRACRRCSCRACSTHAIRWKVRDAVQAIKDWSFDRHTVTLLFPAVSPDALPVEVVDQHYQWAAKMAAALGSHPQVMAFLLKVEVDQGRNGPGGLKTVVFHLHVDMMTLCASAAGVVDECKPNSVRDFQIDEKPSEAWPEYLGKPVVHPGGKKRDPAVLAKVRAALDEWQLHTGHKRLFWFGGLYNGTTARWANRGAGIRKALADKSNWPGIEGFIRRAIALKWVKGQTSVKKWGKFAGHYKGKWLIVAGYGCKSKCHVYQVAGPRT